VLATHRYSETEFTKNHAKYLKYPPTTIKERAGTFFKGL
jgi:hypothetical protein